MKNVLYIITTLFFISAAETINDVTGDGVDDELIAGSNSVTVVCGASGKRTVVYKASTDARIDECNTIPLGSKNGLRIRISWMPEGGTGGIFDLVYLMKNGSFVDIEHPGTSVLLTGITLPKLGAVFYSETWTGMFEAIYYWNGSRFVEMTEKFHKGEDEIKIEAGSKKIVPFVVMPNEIAIVDVEFIEGGGSVTVSGYDLKVKVKASDGMSYFDGALNQHERLWDYLKFLPGSEVNGEPCTFYLILDNSEAMMSWRKASYGVVVYKP